MTAAGIDLAMARREAESEMREKCTVTAPDDSPGVWNESTLQYDPPTAVQSYAGKCKVRFGGSRGRQGDQAGQLFVEQDATVAFPVLTSGAIGKDHIVTITESEDDPSLVGAKFKVTAGRGWTNSTQRKLPVKETQ